MRSYNEHFNQLWGRTRAAGEEQGRGKDFQWECVGRWFEPHKLGVLGMQPGVEGSLGSPGIHRKEEIRKAITLWMGWGFCRWDPIQQIHVHLRILKLGELVVAAELVTGNNCGDKPLGNHLEAEGKKASVDLSQITWANPGHLVGTCWRIWGPES